MYDEGINITYGKEVGDILRGVTLRGRDDLGM